MINIAICDDENIIVSQIEELLLRICGKEIPVSIDVFYSGKALEKEILKGIQYDLIYLDIQMKNGDGITTARNLRKMDENFLLIYVSGYDKYMMELFRFDVFSFIKKPIDKNLFIETFMEANKKICNNRFYFSFSYRSQEYKLLCSDILYFESSARQICIHSKNNRMNTFNAKLSVIEEKLLEGKIPFLRIHQSYLVNYYWIKSRTKTEITLIDETKLPISEERQKEFGRQYGKLLGGDIDV